MSNDRPIVDMQDVLNDKAAKGEPVVVIAPVDQPKEVKAAIEKINNGLVERGAKVVTVVNAKT
ncbi:hypothetical protein [Aliagarivorans taiwanensis]|uniref:hypothetical protein n=1 Tax=Aliagarivorans taiwanensis TaxID=561966 RepID=UPI0004086109|nr:hypothetical protein [Aliagarivorans taiwanensis]